MKQNGKIIIIGIGPGGKNQMTLQAISAIESCEVIVGYDTYIDLIAPLLTNQEIIRAGMTEEVARARSAVEQAKQGRITGIISSGDAGLYGMAGLVYEVIFEADSPSDKNHPEVEVVPGITAMLSSASLLGAPLMHDACTISLSDHLTPWDTIVERLDAAGRADFVIALYNPKSKRRKKQIEEAVNILLRHRSPETAVGVVTAAYRENQDIILTTLDHLLEQPLGMLSTIIIGNSTTSIQHGKMITPRGYQKKYQLGTDEQNIHITDRMKTEHEPWSLQLNRQSNLAKNESALRTTMYEFTVSPGFYQRSFHATQVALLADLTGENGELEYTPDHYIILRTRRSPEEALPLLRENKILAFPFDSNPDDALHFKVCDFCSGEKKEPHDHLPELLGRLRTIPLPRRFLVGYTGCGMSCHGAAMEDLAIIYTLGKFEVYAGAKKIGKITSPPRLIATGLDTVQMMETAETVLREYSVHALPNERFYKYIERTRGTSE